MIVQIYEIQTPPEAARCIELGVDHIGSVLLSAADWRVPAIREVVALCGGSGTRSSLIPLFGEEELLFRALDYYRPHLVHFCEDLLTPGGELRPLAVQERKQAAVRRRYPEVRIMRTLPVPLGGTTVAPALMDIVTALEPVTDFFLLDTWVPEAPVADFVGITGRPADWEVARAFVRQARIPAVLAGGLSPDNVADAIHAVRPAGVDSCTWTNRLDAQGRPLRFAKDFEKVARFVQAARAAA